MKNSQSHKTSQQAAPWGSEPRVQFRAWRHSGKPFAVFPEWPADTAGTFCFTYTPEPVPDREKWGTSVPTPQGSQPASETQAAAMLRELEGIFGVPMKPVRRITLNMHRARGANAKKIA